MKYTVHQLIRDLRSGPFTSVGCYPTYFITSDGEALSHKAVRENIWQVARDTRDEDRSGWAIIGLDINWEDPEMFCAHTGDRIESAYAEDEVQS